MLFPMSALHTAAAALCGDEIIHFTLSYVFLACLLLVIPFLLKKYEIAQCQSVVDETTLDDPLPTLQCTGGDTKLAGLYKAIYSRCWC